jgi:hypothetical protein
MPEPSGKIDTGSRGCNQTSKALTPSVAKIAVASSTLPLKIFAMIPNWEHNRT